MMMSLASLSMRSPNNDSINSKRSFHRRNSRVLAKNNNNDASFLSRFVLSSSKRRRYKMHSSSGGVITSAGGLSENALGLVLISLIDDIALLGVTLTSTEQSRKLYEVAEGGQPGDVEAPTGAIFALAILIGGGFLVATTFGLKPGADAQDEMRKRDEQIFNKKIKK
jgi:hypothetical protein